MAIVSKFQDTLSGMTTKQKVLAVITVLMLLFVIYEITQIFPDEGETVTPVVQAPKKTELASTPIPVGAMQGKPVAPAAGAPVAAASIPYANDQVDSEVLRLQQEAQVQYIAKLNELQMLKIQREIAETNQAIAAAKSATVNSERSMSETLTKATEPVTTSAAPEIAALLPEPPKTEANPPVLPTTPEASVKPIVPPAIPTPPPPPQVNYTLYSVVMQAGKWTAVVGNVGANGRLYNVTIGQELPPDGSVVTAIDRNGVTITKDGKDKRIYLNSSI